MVTLLAVILLTLFGAAGFYLIGSRTSARTVWPALVSAPILFVVVPHLTYVGLQQTEEGLLMLVIPFVVGPWSLGLLTGWAFGRPRS